METMLTAMSGENTSFRQKHLMPSVKHGEGLLMIWACFVATGCEAICQLKPGGNRVIQQNNAQQQIYLRLKLMKNKSVNLVNVQAST